MKVEGKNAVLEALKSDVTIDCIYAEKGASHPIVALAQQQGVKLKFVDKFILDKESVSGHHQGFIAQTSDFIYCEVDDIINAAAKKNEPPFIVILDGIEDPHNFGSILRAVECAGAHGIIFAKNRAVCVTETVIRVSSGAAQHVKVARVTNINNTIRELKEKNIWVYAADMNGQSIYKTNLKGALAVVIGGEGNGVSKLTKELCDGVISLPIKGEVGSLNASVACGIVLYEALRQRDEK
ncbi:MAG: 23S rRNA (guanosine(2251)-2'-O)-methyltransferase RlmB [Clostridia bacterium]